MKMKRDRAQSGRFQCCYYLIWRGREAPSVGEIFPGARFSLSVSYTDELNRGKSDMDIEEGYRYSVYFQISFFAAKTQLNTCTCAVLGLSD